MGVTCTGCGVKTATYGTRVLVLMKSKVKVGKSTCECGTRNAPKVWCFVHGYLKPKALVKRSPKARKYVRTNSSAAHD